MSSQALKDYRAAIRGQWMTIVSRKKFTSHEYKLIDEWFAKGIAADIILRAIRQVQERAKRRSIPLYSLGIISNDIAAIQRDRARSQVGGKPSSPPPPPCAVNIPADWRSEYADDLEEMMTESDPEMRAMLSELRSQLPDLSKDQAASRLLEIFR